MGKDFKDLKRMNVNYLHLIIYFIKNVVIYTDMVEYTVAAAQS